jgi:hypothetical protein
MKLTGNAQNVTQEKWNFSLVLMETIVDTLMKVTKSKLQLAKIRAFINWKTSKYDSRLIIWLKYRDSLMKLNSFAVFFKRKVMQKRFAVWNEKVLMISLKKSFDKDLNDIKSKYKSKLQMMSQEINSLNEKQLILEKSSADYMQKERSYKESFKSLEESSEPKETSYSDELVLLQNENLRLKAKLQAKETKLISYFESLSSMIDNAPIK